MTEPGWLSSWTGTGAGAGSSVDVTGGDVASGALYLGNDS